MGNGIGFRVKSTLNEDTLYIFLFYTHNFFYTNGYGFLIGYPFWFYGSSENLNGIIYLQQLLKYDKLHGLILV